MSVFQPENFGNASWTQNAFLQLESNVFCLQNWTHNSVSTPGRWYQTHQTGKGRLLYLLYCILRRYSYKRPLPVWWVWYQRPRVETLLWVQFCKQKTLLSSSKNAFCVQEEFPKFSGWKTDISKYCISEKICYKTTRFCPVLKWPGP